MSGVVAASGLFGADSAVVGPVTGSGATAPATTTAPALSPALGRVGLIWAQSDDGVLGVDGDMAWRVPADFKHFRAATMGCGVVMGSRTWHSLGGALPGRNCVVLTRRGVAGPTCASTLDEALQLAGAGLGPDSREGIYRTFPRVWVVGGAQVYQLALDSDLADVLVISELELDARAKLGPLHGRQLTLAPQVDYSRFRLEASASDSHWRPPSGDARWRVKTWVRA